MNKKNNNEEEEEKKPQAIVQAYSERLGVLKRAQDYSQRGDIPKAVERYMTYLKTLAAYHGTKEANLDPRLFDPEKDIAELLLISHAYWDLAKSYDRSPRLRGESLRCLEQFVRFSTGYKFQHVNAQMVKKFVKRRRAYNLQAFQDVYNRIHVSSKACYIATHCYPNDIELLTKLRTFKNKIVHTKSGFKFVELYYALSPRLISFLERRPKLDSLATKWIFKPIIKVLSKVV